MKSPDSSRPNRTYFQFPLCALAFGPTVQEQLNAIISYGLVEAGGKLWLEKLTERERETRKSQWCMHSPAPKDFKFCDATHLHARAGAEMIGVAIGSFADTAAKHDALADFTKAFAARHGPSPFVRLKSGLVFETRDGGGLDYRQLSVLAAIYSVIGKKQFACITQGVIRRRALGYKTQAVLEAELPRRQDGAHPLTPWQLRSTVDELHSRKFFARVTFARRSTYYSHRITAKQLRDAITESRTRRGLFRLDQRIEDDQMTTQIRALRAECSGRRPRTPQGPLVFNDDPLPEGRLASELASTTPLLGHRWSHT